jgi:hypothetical protein
MKRSLLVLLLFAAYIAAQPAFAGIADSPLPELQAGETTLHLYSVPGAIHNGFLGTFFSCTSTDTTSMQLVCTAFLAEEAWSFGLHSLRGRALSEGEGTPRHRSCHPTGVLR